MTTFQGIPLFKEIFIPCTNWVAQSDSLSCSSFFLQPQTPEGEKKKKNYLETAHCKDVDGGNKSLKQYFSLHLTWLSWALTIFYHKILGKKAKRKLWSILTLTTWEWQADTKVLLLSMHFCFFQVCVFNSLKDCFCFYYLIPIFF